MSMRLHCLGWGLAEPWLQGPSLPAVRVDRDVEVFCPECLEYRHGSTAEDFTVYRQTSVGFTAKKYRRPFCNDQEPLACCLNRGVETPYMRARMVSGPFSFGISPGKCAEVLREATCRNPRNWLFSRPKPSLLSVWSAGVGADADLAKSTAHAYQFAVN